jgi:4-carboxymuconolactone decarboxylase
VIAFGKPLGLTDEQIAATAAGDADDPSWSEREKLLIRFADEVYDTCTVSAQLWCALAERYADDQLLELLTIAGWYRLLSGLINAVGIERESWAARFPSR